MMPPEQLNTDALRLKSQSSLYFFAKGVLGYDWLVPHIHGPLCLALEELAQCLDADPAGEDELLNRLLCELPRGWLKTTLCSIAFPIWLSIRKPNIRILVVQNSATNAQKKLSVIRGQWEQNDLLRTLFPELLPTKSSVWKADSLCITRSASFAESTYEAAGTSTRVVSRHYDVVIEDDTVAPDYDELGKESLAPTHEDVQKAIGWHRSNVLPLLNNPRCGINLVVGTRWYDQDLIRWVKDNEPQFRVISRACRENAEGKADPKGELTYPERFGNQTLRELETALGQYMFFCLYYNMPVRSEDMAFRSEWFEYYEVPPVLSSLAIYTTVDVGTDPKLSKSGHTDYCVVMTCGKDLITGHVYVLDYFHKQANPGELCAAIFAAAIKYNPVVVAYQGIAFERSLNYWLKELMRQHQHWFNLMQLPGSNREDAKNRAIEGLIPLFQNGVIYLRTWMRELVSELTVFPLGRNDDLADALSMQQFLWKRTKTKREYRQIGRVTGGLTLESGCAEIKARRRGGLTSATFDSARSSSQRFLLSGSVL